MAMTVGELVARGKVDDSEFNRGLDRMERRFGGMAGRLAGMLDRFRRDQGAKMGAAGEQAGKNFGARLAQATLDRLRAARSVFSRSGSDAGKAHAEALTRDSNGRLRDSKGRFAKSGHEIAMGFLGTTIKALQGHAGAITELIKNPYVMATAAVVGIGVSVAALAAVGGIALAGIGGGFIALGIKAVAGSKRVQEATKELSTTWKTSMSIATASIEGPVIGVLGRLRKTVKDLTPDLRDMFEDIAPHIDNLGAGLDKTIRKLIGGGGLADAVEASGGVLDQLGAKLPDTGSAFNDFFEDIAEGSEGAGSALVSLLSVVNGAIKMMGEVIKGASFTYQKWLDLVNSIPGPMSNLTRAISDVDKEQGDAEGSAGDLSAQMDGMIPVVEGLAAAHRTLAQELSKSTLDVQAATTSASESRRRLSESLKENGTSFKLGTKAGDENRSMLERVARDAANVRDTVMEMAKAQGDDAPTAMRKADAAMAGQVNALRALLKHTKMSDKEIDELLRSFGLMPPAKSTKVSAPGADSSKKAIDGHNTAASKVPASKSTRLRMDLTYGSAEAAARWRGAGPGSHRSSTLHLNLTYGSADAAEKWNRARGGIVSKYAQGGKVRGFANGGFSGYVRGPGTTTSDSILARLSDKEFVVKASSVARLGVPLLNHLNNTGRLPLGFAGGGSVAAAQEILNRLNSGGSIFEDLSWRGMSANARRFNDLIAGSFGGDFDPSNPRLRDQLIRGVSQFIQSNSATSGGMGGNTVVAELRALRADVRALQGAFQVRIGDDVIARSARRGEHKLGYRG